MKKCEYTWKSSHDREKNRTAWAGCGTPGRRKKPQTKQLQWEEEQSCFFSVVSFFHLEYHNPLSQLSSLYAKTNASTHAREHNEATLHELVFFTWRKILQDNLKPENNCMTEKNHQSWNGLNLQLYQWLSKVAPTSLHSNRPCPFSCCRSVLHHKV